MENALFNLNSIPFRAKRIKIISSDSYIEKRIAECKKLGFKK